MAECTAEYDRLLRIYMERKKYYRGIKICPRCKGVGIVTYDEREQREQSKGDSEICPQCEGSGRVQYRTEVVIVEEPYPGLFNIGV